MAIRSIDTKDEPSESANTQTITQPQIITCPYCESQEVDCLSTEKIIRQLTLFEGGAVKTDTRVQNKNKFICQCGAMASLSWKEAKED